MNAERSVLDSIAELERTDDLVEWQLSRHAQRSGYDHNVNQESCTLCGTGWHGLATSSCPGAWATEEQRVAFTERQRARRPSYFWAPSLPQSWDLDWTNSHEVSGAMGLLQQIPAPQWRNPSPFTSQHIYDEVVALDMRTMQYPPTFPMFPSEVALARLRREYAPPVQPLDPGQPLRIELSFPIIQDPRRPVRLY